MLPANAIIIARLKRYTWARLYSFSRSTNDCLTPAKMLQKQAGSSWGPPPATYITPHVLPGAVLPKLSVYCLNIWVLKGGFLLPQMPLSPSFELFNSRKRLDKRILKAKIYLIIFFNPTKWNTFKKSTDGNIVQYKNKTWLSRQKKSLLGSCHLTSLGGKLPEVRITQTVAVFQGLPNPLSAAETQKHPAVIQFQ